MKRRIAIVLAVLCGALAAVLCQAPAALLDLGVRQASEGRVRIADARGSAWNGEGVILADAAAGHGALPLGQLGWRLAGFRDGALEIALAFDGRPLGRLRLDVTGIGTTVADWRLPAAGTLALLPGALGRGQWEGQLALTGADGRCDWLGRCTGHAQLAWSGAATRRIENGALGDYQLALDGNDGRVDFELSSGEGPIALTGKGRWQQGQLRFDGLARGNDAVLSQFPGFLGKVFEATGRPGEYRITVER